jgi:hypothetical protein
MQLGCVITKRIDDGGPTEGEQTRFLRKIILQVGPT